MLKGIHLLPLIKIVEDEPELLGMVEPDAEALLWEGKPHLIHPLWVTLDHTKGEVGTIIYMSKKPYVEKSKWNECRILGDEYDPGIL